MGLRPVIASALETEGAGQLVNEEFAKLAWPAGNAIGAKVRTGPDLREVVGVIVHTSGDSTSRSARRCLFRRLQVRGGYPSSLGHPGPTSPTFRRAFARVSKAQYRALAQMPVCCLSKPTLLAAS